MKRKLITLFVLFALLLAGLLVRPARAVGVTIYVVAGNHCLTPCGNSWVNAHPNLQDALAAAVNRMTRAVKAWISVRTGCLDFEFMNPPIVSG